MLGWIQAAMQQNTIWELTSSGLQKMGIILENKVPQNLKLAKDAIILYPRVKTP